MSDQGELGRSVAQVVPKRLGLVPEQVREKSQDELAEVLGGSWPDDPARARQLKRELETWVAGYDKLLSGWHKAKDNADALRMSPVRKLVDAWVAPLSVSIEKVAQRHLSGNTRRYPAWLRAYGEIGSAGLAFRALAAVVNMLLEPPRRGKLVTSTRLALRIGEDVEFGMRLAAWKRINPGLFDAYEKRLDEAGATAEHRKVVMRIGLEKKARDPERASKEMLEATERWPKQDRIAAGLWLLLEAERAVGGHLRLKKQTSGKGAKGLATVFTVEISDEAMAWIEQAIEKQALGTSSQRPMLCEPLPWTGPVGGGYLLGMRRSLVPSTWDIPARVQNGRLEASPPDILYDALNMIQRVPWRINVDVLPVAQGAVREMMSLDCLPQRHILPLPPKPANVEDKEAMKRWRAQAAEVERKNARGLSRAVQCQALLTEAEELVDEPAIWFPSFLDFRGRIYTGGRTPSPQGDDLSKGVLEFAKGQPIGEAIGPWWLAAQVAKSFGQDKLRWEDRVAWTMGNRELIEAVASDPLGHRQLWEANADGLWTCLAAAREWMSYLASEMSPDFITHLPCYIDGTCNGIQHYAALARDENLARIVNLEPGDVKHDIYQEVADKLYSMVLEARDRGSPEERRKAELWLRLLGDKAPRTLAKKVVMVKPYGGTMKVTLEEVQSFWRDAGGEDEWRDVELTEKPKLQGWLAKKLQAALGARVGSADKLMAWLQQVTKVLAKAGVLHGPAWTTPSGWPWINIYMETVSRRIQMRHGDGSRKEFYLQEEVEHAAHARKQATGVAPNFVHGLDAAALVMAVHYAQKAGIEAITTIHDSVGGLAPDMDVISNAVRQGFVTVHRSDPLQAFLDAAKAALPEDQWDELPPIPTRGDFDVWRVMRSRYFFC